jgi:hypothetical protein
VSSLLLQRETVASFKANDELWSKFKTECKVRGVSVCHVLEALMGAWIEGQRATATVVKPVVVNLTMQHVVQRPRRAQRFDQAFFFDGLRSRPPPCESIDVYRRDCKGVGCLEKRDWVGLEECWRCFRLKEGY